MDETVIREIADQLGIATDNAAQFVADNLQQYASMRIFNLASACVNMAVLTVCLLIAFCVLMRIKKRYGNKENVFYKLEFASQLSGYLAAICGVALIIILMICIPDIIGWQQFPEAKAIDAALQAIKG